MIGATGDLLKRVDPWLSSPGAVMAAALRPRRRARSEKLLIVRPGGMGDLVMAQLAAETIGLDGAEVRWLVESRSASWARHAGLDHLSYDRSPLKVLRDIGGRHQRVVNTEQRFGLTMSAARWALARGGTLTAFNTNRAARYADRLVSYDWDRAREVDEFGRLLGDATGRTWRGLNALSRRRQSDGRYVVALGGTHHPSRHLTTQDWAQFIRSVAGDREVVLTAGPMEAMLADELRRLLGERATIFSGDFDSFVERIATAERVVAVDGGPVHIATYYGVPSHALFTSGRHDKWTPLVAGSVVHRRDDLACQPCTVFGQVPPCPFGYRCRADIPGALQQFPVQINARFNDGR